MEEIQDLKGKKKELMIEGEKELEEVKALNNQVEADLEWYDQPLRIFQCSKKFWAANQIKIIDIYLQIDKF